MSVLVPEAGEVFTIRTYKHQDIAVTSSWANTYEAQATTGVVFGDLTTMAAIIMSFEKRMSQDTVIVDRAVVSTWIPDGQPYNPASFVVVNDGGSGLVTSPAADEVLSLDICLHLRRDVASGRQGKLFLRGALDEGDVAGRYGDIYLTDAAGIEARLSDAVSDSGLDAYMGLAESSLKLVMASLIGEDVITRTINQLVSVNAKIVKLNHKYFDRS